MKITYKGTEHDLPPLTGKQMLEHAAAMRDLLYSDLKKSLVGLPLELCTQIFLQRSTEIRKVEHGAREHRARCLDYPGLAYALYLALKDKGCTPEEAVEMMNDSPVDTAITAIGLMRMPINTDAMLAAAASVDIRTPTPE